MSMEGARKRKGGTTSDNKKSPNPVLRKCMGIKNVCKSPVPQLPVVPVLSQISIESLPNEMVEQVLQYLDLSDKQQGRQVCHSWRNIIDQFFRFRVILSDETFDAVRKFDCNRPIKVLTVQDCSKRISPASFSRSLFAKTVSHIVFKIGDGTVTIEQLIDEAHGCWNFVDGDWTPGVGTTQENIITLLRIHPLLENLTIGPMAFEKIRHPPLLEGIRLSYLTRLELSFGDDLDDNLIEDMSPILPYQKFLMNRFPRLKTFLYTCKASYKPFELLMDIYFFIARHKSTLKCLRIDSYETYLFPSVRANEAVCNEMFQNLVGDLCQLELKELYLRVITFVPESCLRWKSLEQTFLRSQTQVEKLSIYWIEELHPSLDFLPSCKELVELTIISNLMDFEVYPVWEFAEKFDCCLLKNCNRLEKLHLDFSEWDFYQENSRARVKNLNCLPTSLTNICFGGYIAYPESKTLARRLNRLQIFSCHGCGECAENVRTVYDFLKDSTACKINLLHDSCMLVFNFVSDVVGVFPYLSDSEGITVTVNRSIFDPNSLPLYPLNMGYD